MIKIIYFCVLLLGIVTSSCRGDHLPEDDEQDPNSFVDSIFATAIKKIHEQGAIPIPGEHKVEPFGLFTIKDINLLSIDNLVRRGDSYIRGDEDSGIININTSFSLVNVAANSSFVIIIPIKGSHRVSATISIKQIDMTVQCEYNPSKGTLKPTSVHIDSFTGVETSVSGLGPFNPIAEKMTTITADVLEKIIAKILNLTLAKRFNGVTIDIPQPQ